MSRIELVLTYKMFVFGVLRLSTVIAQKSDIFVPKVIRISSVLFLGFYVSVALVAWKNGFFPYYRWLHAESGATEL